MNRVILGLGLLLLGSVVPAKAQTALSMRLRWSNGTEVSGEVTVQHTANGVTAVDYKASFTGSASFTLAIQADTMYTAIVTAANPKNNSQTQIQIPFMVPSLIMNPASLKAASVRTTLSTTTDAPVPGSTQISVTF